MGAPLGNKNGTKQKRMWGDAIERALTQSDPERLRRLAEKLITKAEEGDLGALKEIGDRVDGKSAQQIVLAGDRDNPVLARIERVIVKHD